MPILACAMHADEGALRSGVEVATIIKSISFGSSPAEEIAFRPARAARSDVYSSGSAMHRSRIPNVSTIHSGEVGKFPTTTSFFRILAGTYEPVDLMQTLSKRLFLLLIPPPITRKDQRPRSPGGSRVKSRWASHAVPVKIAPNPGRATLRQP